MAIWSSAMDTVCVVTVVKEDSQTDLEAQSQERACSAVESDINVIAAHANCGNGEHS